MAKTFAKIAKTFARLSTTIIATRRRLVLILHLEAKYEKIDYKNEIYAKNWVRSTWIAKVNSGKKSMVKVNVGQRSGQRWRQQMTWQWHQQMTWQWWCHLGLTSQEEPSAWQRVGALGGRVTVRGGAWRILAAHELLRRIFWRHVRAGGSSDDCQVSTRR